MKVLVAFVTGVVFAMGLALAGMTQPSKVVGFLDFSGAWDASLAFVMGGAVLVNLVAYRLSLRRRRPVLDTHFHLPSRDRLEWRLVVGSVLFGVGWGLSGYCPGPAVASVTTGGVGVLSFVGAMLAGMALFEGCDRLFGRVRTPLAQNPILR